MIIVIVASLLVCALVLACLLVTALAGGWVRHSVVVDAPVADVWAYGSDSTLASEWSVFFDHITPDATPGRPMDGTVGAFRRCYRDPAEQGPTWDETTEAIEPLRQRRIRTFNLVGFTLGPIGRAQEYDVFQDYEAIDATHTRLTFSSCLRRRPGLANLLAWPLVKAVYVVFAQPAGQEVFVVNLENIKAAVEARHAGRPYVRPHPWAAQLPCEATPIRWWLANRLARLTSRQPGSVSPSGERIHATA
ncbi:MAG: hypothetical protein JWM98_903 [Thermoleophilia bacterium]|nr:hypothetical protein [Thermoleophilia bacterium]